MSVRSAVAPIKVDDEDFLVASTIERCPKTMMLRELFKNALEAAFQAPEGKRRIEIKALSLPETPETQKLAIWNTGPGMAADELHRMCDLASSIGKEKGLDANFGMGAKVASLPSNKFGLRYRSCKRGSVSEVVLCQRDGVYGRLRRLIEDEYEEVIDVTDAVSDYAIDEEWTEVVLLGNNKEQNTARNPYDGNPSVTTQWIADYLYHRFYRLPPGIEVRLYPGTHKLDGARLFKTIEDRKAVFETTETVVTETGIKIHYYYDAPYGETSHNRTVSGALATDISVCGVVFKDEFYDLKKGRAWHIDAPIFGIPFGAKHISIHIELCDDSLVVPEGYRQFLRYKEGEQRQVSAQDFAELVRDNRPAWLLELIKKFAPSDSLASNEVQKELQDLLNSLRLKRPYPTESLDGTQMLDAGRSTGLRTGGPNSSGMSPRESGRLRHDDLDLTPAGARKAKLALNMERAPRIIELREKGEIEEKELTGKAARFYPASGELFINMLYPAINEMKHQLETDYAATQEHEIVRDMALLLSERSMMIRVGRAVVYGLAKKLNSEWTQDDMERALSPESLSLAADDYVDSLQNARRHIGTTLRASRQTTPTEQVTA